MRCRRPCYRCVAFVAGSFGKSLTVHKEMYTPVLGQSPLIDTLFARLRKKVAAELRFQKELVKAKGALDMLLASAALSVS